MKAVRCVAAVGCGLVVLMAAGCGQGPKDQQIEAHQQRINELEAEKQGLMGRLAHALSERDAARGREFNLQQQLADLRARMASAEGQAEQRGRWTVAAGIAWTDIADNILFDSGKATLKSAGKTELQQIATEIRQQFAGRQIWIVGHTDSDPILVTKSLWKDNLDLSVNRACAVHRELQTLGLNPREMVAAGQGEHNPKAPNEPKTKHVNRRVQIIAVEVPETTGGLEDAGEQG